MNAPKYSRMAARLLGRQRHDASAGASEDVRKAHVSAVEAAILRRHRHATWRRWAYFSAAAAACVAIGVLGRAWSVPSASAGDGHALDASVVSSDSGAVAISRGHSRALFGGRSLHAGDRIVTPRIGRTTLALETGTRLDMSADSDLEFASLDDVQRFVLRGGSVHARVARLHEGQRFIIDTHDSEIEVHGTSFRVDALHDSIACHENIMTRVTVDEGVVSVRHDGEQVLLHAGEFWPQPCTAEQTLSAPNPVASPHAHAGISRSTQAQSAQHALQAQQPLLPQSAEMETTSPEPALSDVQARSSTLGAENDAFADAVAMRRADQRLRAVSAFENFVQSYPRSQLVESARVESMRLLRQLDPARARLAARAYLLDYPDGVARTEAHEIIGLP